MRKTWLFTFGLCILLAILVVVSSCVSSTSSTPAPVTYSNTVAIAPGYLQTIPVSVTSSNRVQGSFTVQGGSGNDVNFSIKDPFGNQVLQAGVVSKSHSFAFVAATSGSYVLSFDNSFSMVSNKVVKYNFTVYWK